MTAPIRVLVVDDQAIVRDGLVTVLDLLPDVEVVGAAADGDEALALAATTRPDVVLMDLRMPGTDGVTATARLARDVPDSAVLVLTTYADDESIVGALRAGARGYLTKDAGRADLASAVRAVARGQSTFGATLAPDVIRAVTASARPATPADLVLDRFPRLTRREAEVVAAMAEGLNNREIGERLFIGLATVKTHVNAAFGKLGVRDRAQAIALVRS